MSTIDFLAVLESNVVSPFVNFQALKTKYQISNFDQKYSKIDYVPFSTKNMTFRAEKLSKNR